MHYIVENDGLDEFYAMGKEMQPRYGKNMQGYDALRKWYGETFFEDYAAWLEQNADRFADEQWQVDFSQIKRIDLFPFVGLWTHYQTGSFTYSDYIVLDFLSGFDYAENYLGLQTNRRISGTISCDGKAQVRFYDAQGNVLETLKLYPGVYRSFSVENATLAAIVGDGEAIDLNLAADEMFEMP